MSHSRTQFVLTLFPALVLYTRLGILPFLHWMFSGVCRVFSASFLWSTFVWQFDPACLCVLLVEVVASFIDATDLIDMFQCMFSFTLTCYGSC